MNSRTNLRKKAEARRRTPAKLLSLAFWQSYLVTARPYLFYVSGIIGLVGLSLSEELVVWRFVTAFFSLFFFLGFGQALSDIFDRDTDRHSSPDRPMMKRLIRPRDVFIVSFAGLIACSAVMFILNPLTLAINIAIIAAWRNYRVFKRLWWIGPFWKAFIISLIMVDGYLAGGSPVTDLLTSSSVQSGFLTIFFAYTALSILGSFKDISADRRTGFRTLPVLFGWRPSVIISAAFAGAAGVYSFLFFEGAGLDFSRPVPLNTGISFIFLGISWVFYVLAHIKIYRVRGYEDQAFRGIEYMMRGFIFMTMAEVLVLKPQLLSLSVAYYLFFEFAFHARPNRAQV
jgi:4-hydroxybenzoate polyprenyltransferase